jgi:hypothetical protein
MVDGVQAAALADDDGCAAGAGPAEPELDAPHAVSVDAAVASKTTAVAARFTADPPVVR